MAIASIQWKYPAMRPSSPIEPFSSPRIVLGEETSALREKVKGLLAEGKKKLVLNMDGVKLADSSGLGALVAAYSSAKSAGASMRLCNLGSHFNQLLQMTKLLTVFEVSNTEAEAARSPLRANIAETSLVPLINEQ
jgi:anti-sigma B factor antagonist